MKLPARLKSLLWLIAGAAFLLVANGRWAQSWGIWIALFFLLRFVAAVGPWIGFFAILAAAFSTNLLIWKGMLPLPTPIYQIVNLITALFFAVPILLHRTVGRKLNGFAATLVYPCALVATQYLLSRISPSCTYGSIAYTQTFDPLLQLVALTGIWGILFVIAWSSSVFDRWSRHERMDRGAIIYGAVVLAVLGFGWLQWLHPNTEVRTVKVAALVGGSFNYDWSHPIKDNQPAFMEVTRVTEDRMLKRSAQAAVEGARVVFWQEAALPLLKDDESRFLAAAAECARINRIYLGVTLFVLSPDFPRVWAANKIYWLDPDGKRVIDYTKAHPTPAESVIRGSEQIESTVFDGCRFASVICFDMDFPTFLRQAGAQQVDLLCVPANDSREITPYHTRIASFRAIEEGFSLVRATGNGLSAAYDPSGRELAALTLFDQVEGQLLVDVPLRRRTTLYTVVGDASVWVCTAGLALLVIAAFRRRDRDFAFPLSWFT